MKSKRSAKELKGLLPQLKKILGGIYGDRLKDVILYGSFTRAGEQRLEYRPRGLCLKAHIHKIEEIDRIYDSIYELMLECGELISILPVSEEEMKNRVWPLYYHIQNEGVRLWTES